MAILTKLQQLTRDAEEFLASANDLSGEDDSVRIKAVDTLRKLTRRLETPLELSRRLAWQEPAHLVSIKIALDMGLFKLMQANPLDNRQTVAAMAVQLNQPEELVGRILRHLAAWDTVREIDMNTFAATATSNAFLDASVASGLDFWIHLASIGMRNMPKYIRDGNYDLLEIPGKGNFEQANGTGKHLFDWLNESPEAFRAHTDHLNAFSTDRIGWLDTYPAQQRLLEGIDSTTPLLVDIGGGLGRDVFSFERKFPTAKGQLVVQDPPEVIADLSATLPSDSRVDVQAHDFFTPQSIHGARAYLLHYILHDWSDADCLRILDSVKIAMRKDYSRLLVVESIIADRNADAFSTALDITIMSMVGAKERSEQHWRDLLTRAGLHIEAIHALVGNAECVIEAVL